MKAGAGKVFAILIILQVSANFVSAQTPEDLSANVVFLHGRELRQIEGVSTIFFHFGTGFFVQDKSVFYLVTAEHVVRQLPREKRATINSQGDIPSTYDIERLTGYVGDLPWVFHPEADVAVLRVYPPEAIRSTVKFLPRTVLVEDERNFDRRRMVTVIGFPLALGTEGKFSPIQKSSKLASGLLRYPRFDNKKEATFFLLDDPSVGGFSGAPAFMFSEVSFGGVSLGTGPFRCVGLVHGTLGDRGGFAFIVPSWFIGEAIAIASRGN